MGYEKVSDTLPSNDVIVIYFKDAKEKKKNLLKPKIRLFRKKVRGFI